ncbi:MAG: 5'/3'-nucleotidase SurE [Anaerolineales bacterium]|nr:5'/3'-nucleotidase SurE [Anaerolineales bacterium]
MTRPLILLTNDDGIHSPGLAAAASALDCLGELLIVAPAVQQTSMGRSRSQLNGADGRISPAEVIYQDQRWQGYAANATPALAVSHAIQEIASRPIDLAVSGINYGENIGSCVTVSGTIGAAIEAADQGIPALAVSLEILGTDYHSHNTEINFEAAAHFTRLVAQKILAAQLPFDVDVLKLEIPAAATNQTKAVITRQDRLSYYMPSMEKRSNLSTPADFKHTPSKGQYTNTDTDAYALAQGLVCITPLSIDLTSRIALAELSTLLDTPFI